MQRRSRFVVASFLGKCCQAREGRGPATTVEATKDEHEDNVVAATLVSGLFKCLARYFDVGAKQRRAPKFHPRQIQSTCKPDNIHPNAGEARHIKTNFKVREYS